MFWTLIEGGVSMRKLLNAAGVCALVALTAACSKKSGDTNVNVAQGGSSGAKELSKQKISRFNYFLGAPGFLVKNSEILRGSINECLQDGLLAIKPEMISGGGGEGRKAILGQNFQAAAGRSDIIEVLAGDLYDPMRVSRVDTAAGYLTLTYMGALATVADVVAWNCNFNSPDSRCDCSTEEKAKQILQRCIPAYSDADVGPLAGKFAAECSVADVAKKREILAAFIASATFAELR